MNRFVFLFLHILIGLAGFALPGFSTAYGLFIFLLALSKTLSTSNRNGWAHLGAAYIVGMEVWLRMTKAGLFWEFGKIAASFLLLIGMALEGRLLRKPIFLLLILLLLPSIFLVEGVSFDRFRQALTFQLGGMVLLAFSGIYFFRRPFSIQQFQKLLLFFIGPILFTVIQITLRSPAVTELKFDLQANFATSGGYGPNQVSTIIGLGIASLALNFIFRLPPLFSRWIDLGLLGFFTLRILLTFSRGGMVAAVLAIGLGYLIYLIDKGISLRRLLIPLSIGAVLVFSFFIVDNITQGALLNRYKGETYSTIRGIEENTLSNMTSGRYDILLSDLKMWGDSPVLGVGVGMSNVLRPNYGVNNISHMEQSRLLAEHGILGLLVLLIILFLFLGDYFRRRGIHRAILVVFFLLSFLTMLHSATRLAMVGFVYGLGFIILTNRSEKPSVRRQPPLPARHYAHHH